MSAIYWIGAPAVGMVKVGYTRDLAGRIRDLRASSPTPLEILCWLDVETVTHRREGTAIERRIHNRYLTHHSHGEWFRDNALIQSDVMAVKAETFDVDAIAEPDCTAALLRALHPNRLQAAIASAEKPARRARPSAEAAA